MISPRAKAIIEERIYCSCRKCEEAVQDILRMEQMLCHGAKTLLGHRRGALRRVNRNGVAREAARRRAAAARDE